MPGDVRPDDDPNELVPGDPDHVWEMSGSFDTVGMAFEDIGLGFRAIDFGNWEGAAADAFHARFEDQPKRFLVAADAFVTAAAALDTYASALSWAQRQAAEAVALVRHGDSLTDAPARNPSLTLAQQAEETGVLTGDSPRKRPVTRAELQAAAAGTLRRAREQLHVIGGEAAARMRVASDFAPRHPEIWAALPPPVRHDSPPVRQDKRMLIRSTIRVAPVDTVLHHPDVRLRRRLDHESMAGVPELVKRLRRLGLDQLSPRLRQHIFEGHLKKRKRGTGYRDLGYHHREAGIDRGPVRVLDIVAGPDVNGVYRAHIAGPRTEGGAEPKTSTFFPDSWTQDEVLHAIRHAFVNRTHFDRRDPSLRHKWRGAYRGVHIEGFVERQFIEPGVDARSARLYHIVAAYPVYRRGEARGQDG
jgi:hypothetical protein